MTFRDAVDDLAAEFLAAMDDTCTIREPAEGAGAYDTGTRTYDGGAQTVRYTGVCLVRPRTTGSTQYGERQIETVAYDALLPSTATDLAPDQQVTVDSIGSPTLSPLLVGSTLTVLGVVADTFNARVVLECELNRGGGNAT